MGNENSGNSRCYSCSACNKRNYTSCDNCNASCCVENMSSHRELFRLSEEFVRELDKAEEDLYREANNIKSDLANYYSIYLSNYSNYSWRGILNSLEAEINNLFENYKNINLEVEKFENKYKQMKKDSCESKIRI